MLHDEQLFAGVQARIGLYLLVGQRTKFLAAALGEEERAVDDVIRYSKPPSPYTLITIVYLCSPNGISTKLLTLPSRI